MLQLLRAAREPWEKLQRLHASPDKDYAAIAERLVPGAADYLPPEYLFRGDLSAEIVRREVQRQKAFVQRLVELLPELLSYSKFETEDQVVRALSLIDDCFHDFPSIKSGPRRDRARRDAISVIGRAEEVVGQAIMALAALRQIHVNIDMDKFLEGYLVDKSSSQGFEIFLEHLRLRHEILQICLLRAKSEDDYPFISDNRTKAHIVDTAYQLSQYHDGPPLVTTPGSDFSVICSLLYEIVRGKTNESLAGAINRFARSPERIEFDESGEEIEREEAFLLSQALRAMKEAETYVALLEKANATGLGNRPRLMIVNMVVHALKGGNSALQQYHRRLPADRLHAATVIQNDRARLARLAAIKFDELQSSLARELQRLERD